jgi:hypothetical protein
VIDYEVEQPLAGFAKGLRGFFLASDASWLKGFMQISISAGDLGAGNLTRHTFTVPPQITIHTEVPSDLLDRQVAGEEV